MQCDPREYINKHPRAASHYARAYRNQSLKHVHDADCLTDN